MPVLLTVFHQVGLPVSCIFYVFFLINLFLPSRIKSVYKSKLVSSVLAGYLSLRRLVIQRTKMIDETQDSLLELLEDLTSGTVQETRAFIKVE